MLFSSQLYLKSNSSSSSSSSSRGPQFISQLFNQFFQNWAVWHYCSSAHYPKSNGWAELAVKSLKRIYNTNSDGSLLNTNKPVRDIATSKYITTWHQPKRSSTIFHVHLRGHLSTNPKYYQLLEDWVFSRN